MYCNNRNETVRVFIECRDDTRRDDKCTTTMVAASRGDLKVLEVLDRSGAYIALPNQRVAKYVY